MTPRRLLVVAAHPDDEVLGCGGLLAKTLLDGGEAFALIVTEGSSAQYPEDGNMAAAKKRCAETAAERLGGVELEFADLPDMALATLPPVEVTKPIEAILRRVQPEWVLTHYHADLNGDHRVVHEATRVAARPTSTAAHALLAYEVPSSTEWGYEAFRADVFVSLTAEQLELKTDALAAYESELREWPHPRSIRGVNNLAGLRGQEVSRPYAEAYSTVWHRY